MTLISRLKHARMVAADRRAFRNAIIECAILLAALASISALGWFIWRNW